MESGGVQKLLLSWPVTRGMMGKVLTLLLLALKEDCICA